MEWALNQEVDIINCSFVLYRDNEELRTVFKTALRKGVAVFCSTADKGFVHQVVWPAMYSQAPELMSNVFPMACCNELGRPTEYGSEKLAKYLLPGENLDPCTLPGKNDPALVSGSSVATAMASGIASIILGCYKLSSRSRKNQREAAYLIMCLFAKMSAEDTARQEGPKRIAPRLLFPTKGETRTSSIASDFDLGDSQSFRSWLRTRFVPSKTPDSRTFDEEQNLY